jgi:hypothetical protein
MKIKLEYPFNKDWKDGYIVINKEPRRHVILFNSIKDRSTISYARYLMSVKLGRYLKQEEIVDHIDDNKLNDIIENLQILTKKENCLKSSKGLTLIELICPVCEKHFTIEKRQCWGKNRIRTCSRSCGGKYGHRNK